jgi:hypothetical protein
MHNVVVNERIKEICIFRLQHPDVGVEEYLHKHRSIPNNVINNIMTFVNNKNNYSLYNK